MDLKEIVFTTIILDSNFQIYDFCIEYLIFGLGEQFINVHVIIQILFNIINYTLYIHLYYKST